MNGRQDQFDGELGHRELAFQPVANFNRRDNRECAGETVNYTLTISFNGECPPTGVMLTNQLPAGFQFISATSEQGTWKYDAAKGQVVFSLGLVTADATLTVGISAVPLETGTSTNTAIVRFSSSDPEKSTALLDPPLVMTVLPNANVQPPLLTVQRLSPQNVLIGLSGGAGTLYRIDSSADLGTWTLLTNVIGPTWRQTLTLGTGVADPRFYRASGP